MQVLPKDPRHTRAEPRPCRVLLRDHCHELAEPGSHTVLTGDPHTHGQSHYHAESFSPSTPTEPRPKQRPPHPSGAMVTQSLQVDLSDMAGERTGIVAHYPTLPGNPI